MSGTAQETVLDGVTTATAADDLEGLLLRRLGAVVVDAPGDPAHRAANAAGVTALEADLAGRGHVLTTPLRTALACLAPADLAVHGIRLLGRLDALLGADRDHTPLFRGFPGSVPPWAHSMYSRRILDFLLAQPHQMCLHCGRTGDIGALAPCAHLVCSACLGAGAGEQPFTCPVCGAEGADRAAPYLDPAAPLARRRPGARAAAPAGGGVPAGSGLRPLRLAGAADLRDLAAGVLADLLARQTPLPPRDRDDLAVLLPFAGPGLDWLPERIPVRETAAAVLAALLRAPGTAAAARALLPARLETATDVLRLLWAWSGAEPDLLAPPRLRSLPRPLRRDLLAVLDALPAEAVAEDMLRHRAAWKRAGEVLHPFEYGARYPRAAVAFAAVRGTDAARPGAGWLRDAAARPDAAGRLTGAPGGPARVRVRTFAARAEALLAAGDAAGAADLLARRPGELVRRLHQLLRVHAAHRGADGPVLPPGLTEALPAALARVAPGPLLGAWGRLRAPRAAGERRVFFPRGRMALAHGLDDHAPPVPRAASDAVCALLEAELLRRAAPPGGAARGGAAVLDAALADLAVPFAGRAASKALVAVPRGSRLPMPESGRVRLFLHWVEPPGRRTDLDLSVALYDEQWRFTGLCDYTALNFGDGAAVHSGDFTSAPAPRGATEFADLDLDALAAAGARYAVTVVFSYNNVPFEALPDAFTGFLALPGGEEHAVRGGGARRWGVRRGRAGPPLFDPARVEQRFDLAGGARACVPMVVDLAERRALWTDLNLAGAGGLHNVERHHGRLGRLAADVTAHFAPGGRATLWDLAARLAAAGCGEVLVRARDGRTLARYLRGEGEDTAGFAARVVHGSPPDELSGGTPDEIAYALAEAVEERVRFAALVRGDVPARWEDGELYRLHPDLLDAGTGPGVHLLAAGDLVARYAAAP